MDFFIFRANKSLRDGFKPAFMTFLASLMERKPYMNDVTVDALQSPIEPSLYQIYWVVVKEKRKSKKETKWDFDSCPSDGADVGYIRDGSEYYKIVNPIRTSRGTIAINEGKCRFVDLLDVRHLHIYNFSIDMYFLLLSM